MAIGIHDTFAIWVVHPFKIIDAFVVPDVIGVSVIILYSITLAAEHERIGVHYYFTVKNKQKKEDQ
jgi:hypothetical protein